MDYKNKRVTVFGGAGFVGSNLVRRLVEEGAEITVIDNLFTGSWDNLIGVDCIRGEGDITSLFTVNLFVQNCDIVFNLAARNIIASTKDPFSDYETNIGGTLNILLSIKKHPVERMVYTSSASVYGNPKHLPINEDDEINILTPYAASKYGGESYCMAFHESYQLPVVVLRLSNVYGPYQSPNNPYSGVVAKFMDSASRKEPINLHGTGLTTRDFTYVDDVVDALLLAGLSSKAEGEVFNIATGVETKVVDLALDIRDLFWCENMPDITYVDRRDIDNISRRVLNIEKARRKLGWIPKTTLYTGLRLTKEWFDDQERRD